MFKDELWNPRLWPDLWKWLAAVIVAALLKLIFSPLPSTAIYLLLSLTIVKIKSNLNARRELHQVFDRGNVPSLADKNVFSGNIYEIYVRDKNCVATMDKLHQKLGKIYGFFYGPDPWVQCTDLDLLQRIFVTEGHKHVDMTQHESPFVDELNDSLLQLKGNDWRHTRRILGPPFSVCQMKTDNVFEDISKACGRLIDCIEAHPMQSAGENLGRVVDVLANSKKYSIEVILRVAFGVENSINMRPNEKDPLIENIQQALAIAIGIMTRISVMFHDSQKLIGYLAKFTPVGRFFKSIHDRLGESLQQRRKLTGNMRDHERKMIDTIIEHSDSSKMSSSKLKANLFIFLLAGFETSANALACLFWLLTQHQSIQDKLREQLLRDGDQSEYLTWCLKEALRLYPSVPAGIGRVLSEDIEHNGMRLFKGTTVNASIYSIHHSPEYWGQDTEVFRPERFGELHLHPAHFFAFGLGPRNCIGAHLAMSEMRAFVSRVLLRFRLESCEQTPDKINFITPNQFHMIIQDPLYVKFVEL